MKVLIAAFIFGVTWINSPAQAPLKIAKLKYQGGGDWYANKTALPNLIAFARKNWELTSLQKKILLRWAVRIFLITPTST